MKKRIISSFFVVATLMLVLSQTSFAQDMKGKFGIGARVAYINYFDDDFSYSGLNVDVEFDDNVLYGGNLTYFVHQYFSFELSAGYVETDTDLKAAGYVVNAGEIEQIPILLTARTHLSTNTKISPYVAVGIGYYLNDFNLSSTASSYLPAGSELDPDDSIGFHFGAGVEMFFTENLAFTIDAMYIINDTDVELKVPGSLTQVKSFNLNNYNVGLGLKFYF